MITVPVATEHVGCVIDKVGAEGIPGELFTVTFAAVEIQLISVILLAVIV